MSVITADVNVLVLWPADAILCLFTASVLPLSLCIDAMLVTSCVYVS